MKKILPILCSLWLLAGPAVTARSRAPKNSDAVPATAAPAPSQAAPVPAGNGGSGDGQGASSDPNADVNKTLDDVLTKPIDTLVKEMPKSPAPEMWAPTNVQPQPLEPPAGGRGQNEPLRGGAQLDAGVTGAIDGQGGAPVLRGGASIGTMRGLANQNDPDLGDDQLAIEWDRWRNRFLRAVQMQVQASVNNPDTEIPRRRRFDPMTGMMIILPPFPLGTEAWFDCEIGNDGRLARLSITQSSGFQAYDRAVIEGIRALEGTSLLVFPRASKRLSVRQEAGIRTATQANNEYYHFGDVERYSAPRSQY